MSIRRSRTGAYKLLLLYCIVLTDENLIRMDLDNSKGLAVTTGHFKRSTEETSYTRASQLS